MTDLFDIDPTVSVGIQIPCPDKQQTYLAKGALEVNEKDKEASLQHRSVNGSSRTP